MDYEIGSIADLISGSLTPNRPKLTKRASTPMKHKLSPNVTPKSGTNVIKGDFLSPSIQKKKEVAKRTPKRIFQKADGDSSTLEVQSKNMSGIARNLNGTSDTSALMDTSGLDEVSTEDINSQVSISPKKRKENKNTKKNKYVLNPEKSSENLNESVEEDNDALNNKPQELLPKSESKRAKKRKLKELKKGAKEGQLTEHADGNETEAKKKKKKSTQSHPENESFESDSEHESDNDVASETEQEFKDILKETTINKDGGDSSDDEEKDEKKKIEESKESSAEKSRPFVVDETELSRTLFVGNVPISKKTKKDVKKLFNKHGRIESIRIRTIPAQDMHTSPKVALLANKIHPARSTVNVYVKFMNESSVEKALVENNALLGENHLQVTKSDSTGGYHDPRKTLFIGNMPFSMEDEALRALFEKCGTIDSVRIIRDKKLHVGKGFGYVNFTNADGVELALNLSEEDLTIDSRVLRVKRYILTSGKGKDKLPRQQSKPDSKPGRGGFQQRPRGGFQQRSRGGSQQRPRGGFQQRPRGGGFQQRPRGGGFQQRTRGGFVGGSVDRPQEEQTGAFRRINNKVNKQANAKGDKPKAFDDQPKEKKPKKEFVGLTAEKKKPKKKFSKDEKKKRQLSEILTKKTD